MVDLPIPQPPGWSIDWDRIQDRLPFVAELAACPQDPRYHGEGDVWTHTRLVARALVDEPRWRDLPPARREALFLAALLHDLGKPATTREEDGRLTSPGHSRKGAHLAREWLWWEGASRALREQVAGLVALHTLPFHLVEATDARVRILRASWTVGCGDLALLARADARGRQCADQDDLLDRVEWARQLAEEWGCGEGPFPFPSERARFQWFRKPERDPLYDPWDTHRCQGVLMSGLPGAGKDTWIREHLAGWPVISLDQLREDLDIGPEEAQGPVVRAAWDQARDHLRARRDFIWNATNVTRATRSRLIDLFAAYDARIRIVALEQPPQRLLAWNRGRLLSPRGGAAMVPEEVIRRLVARWEPPDWTEAHALEVEEGEGP